MMEAIYKRSFIGD